MGAMHSSIPRVTFPSPLALELDLSWLSRDDSLQKPFLWLWQKLQSLRGSKVEIRLVIQLLALRSRTEPYVLKRCLP